MDGWIYYYHRQKFVTKYVVNTDKKEKHGKIRSLLYKKFFRIVYY